MGYLTLWAAELKLGKEIEGEMAHVNLDILQASSLDDSSWLLKYEKIENDLARHLLRTLCQMIHVK